MVLSYVLTRRQQIAYTDRFNIHAPVTPEYDAGGILKNTEWSPTPVMAMVPCLWNNRPDINELMEPMGRSLSESFDVLDYLFMPAGVQVKDQYYVQCRTKNHPQYGEWFCVMGFGALRISRGHRQGNYIMVRLKRMLCPPGCEGVVA